MLEWEVIRSLTGDRSIVNKKADKGSCILEELENNLSIGKFTKSQVLQKAYD